MPHPDDLVLNARTGEVIIKGPLIDNEKEAWAAAHVIKGKCKEVIASGERKLRKNPDHPERARLLKDISKAERDLERLGEVFRDDITERIASTSELELTDEQVTWCRARLGR